MYFETGQGSALSANANFGVDQQTCEARAYALARRYRPLLINTVVGFIGPEYLYDGKQIIRAGLEDHFCGKLLGLPMGCDICYTNHAEADQDDMDTLLVLLGAAGINFIMGVPGADDVMLNYQSTSFHDALFLRETLGLARAPEFEAWLQRMQITAAPMASLCNRAVRQSGAAQHGRPRRTGRIMSAVTPSPGRPGVRATPARLALGRAGTGMPTDETLRFGWCPCDGTRCDPRAARRRRTGTRARGASGWPVLRAHSSAPDRTTYLRRPDLGRRARCGRRRPDARCVRRLPTPTAMTCASS